MKYTRSDSINISRRIHLRNQPNLLLIIIIILFGSIGARLTWLQIFRGNFYRKLSDENRIRLISSPPIRGRFLDLNGNVLADNRLVYSLRVKPHLINKNNWPGMAIKLSQLHGVSLNDLNKKYHYQIENSFTSITIASEMSPQQVLRFREQENNLKGAHINTELIRHYPFEKLASHVLGYTQYINYDEYKKLSNSGYKLQDRIGRTGLEAAFEKTLRGKWGGEMLEVDASGVVQKSLGYRAPKAGHDLVLTIDLSLQQAAEKVLEGKKAGAVIALDPRTGAVRAMASKPNFNPNFFTKSFTTQKEFEEIFNSSSLPLLSRALNAYDPGSTWKVVTGIAGMESGKFLKDIELETFPCIKYGSHCFPEHNREGFGVIGYQDALRVSSNTFFYQVGVGTGIKELYKAAAQLGFHSRTGIELANEESKGFVGTKEWAAKGRGWDKPGRTPWIPEDIASASIGQAVVQVTPLQLARAYAVFANGGYLITPHLVEGDIEWYSPKYRKKLDIKPSTLETLRQGLRKVVQSGTGAAIKSQVPNLPPAAGKSGTAEDSAGGRDHAWFVCFAPYDGAEIVVVAFAQNTPGGGSVHALPMASQVLNVWNQNRDFTNKFVTPKP